MSIAIPKTLLATLQATFDAEAKKLAKDAAKILKVPDKEVLQILKSVPKVQLKVVDDDEYPSSCPVFVSNTALLSRCRKPCLLGTGRCTEHQNEIDVPTIPETVKTVTRIQSTEELQTILWCDEDTKDVYDSSGTIVGQLNEENTLEYFVFE